MHGEVVYSKADMVATVTIETRDGRNALSPQLCGDIREAVADAQADPDVRALLLTGAGENFCIDADPELDPDADDDQARSLERRRDLFGLASVDVTDALIDFDKPIVAAVNGVAAGGGCDIAVCCDIRVASDVATIGPSQIQRGLVPGAAIYFLPRVVRFGKACEMLFTGELVDAQEAERIGLFDQVVPATQLATAANELATSIANGPPVAMRLTKRAIYRGLALNSDAAKEYTVLARSLGMYVTHESREGFNSFTEKRPPRF